LKVQRGGKGGGVEEKSQQKGWSFLLFLFSSVCCTFAAVAI
jgi:hypothetical protein